MFDIGIFEFLVILVVGTIAFGPDRLPEVGRQAGRMVRQFKRFSEQTRDDIRRELGPEYSNFELTDLDPRRALRKHIMEAWDDEEAENPDKTRVNPLTTDLGPAPYDPDAT